MSCPPPAKKPRFAEASEKDVAQVVEDAVPTATKKATSFWLDVFSSFIAESGIHLDLKTCSATELNGVLGRFYVSLRNKEGGMYMKNSYLAARAAIGRHVTVNLKRPFNVFQSPELQGSNRVLDGVLKKNKSEGVEKSVVHKDALKKEDLDRLDEYFSEVLTECDPVKLTQYCWLQLTLHFALRGSEVQIQLKKNDIVFKKDASGKEYVALSTDFMTKNCRGGLDGRSFQTFGRLQEEKQVSAMRLLVEKLHPDIERLFHRALVGKQPLAKPCWFMKSPLGRVIIQDMMPRLSVHANLSMRYTNHCVRATSVVLLKKAGFDDREVCFITGHANPKSLNSYSRPDESTVKKMAIALDKHSDDYASTSSQCPAVAKEKFEEVEPKAEPKTEPLPALQESSGKFVFNAPKAVVALRKIWLRKSLAFWYKINNRSRTANVVHI